MNKSTLLVAPILLGATSIVQGADTRPNIIYILADDLGYECVGAYGSKYKTPNLDKLAEHGKMYLNCHAMPLSSPTRVQTMTGRYNYKNYERFGYMNPKENTFVNLAKIAGYDTGIAGKWQLEGDLNSPKHWGFDEYCLWHFTHPKSDGDYCVNPLLEQNGVELKRSMDIYGPDVVVGFVEDYIERHTESPFFLYYPMMLVHKPVTPTPDSPLWKSKKKRAVHNNKNFPALVEYMDKMVGRVITKLKEEGLYENTLIIFAGDNGTQRGLRTPMKDGTSVRGGKSTPRDAGTHVPLIVSWPKKIKRGGVMHQLVDVTDFMNTFADAMRVEVPEEWDTDGISIMPQLLGKRKAPEREYTVCHFDKRWEGYPSDTATRSVRTVDYKLYLRGGFYDMRSDRFEKAPLDTTQLVGKAKKEYELLRDALAALPEWSNEGGVSKEFTNQIKKEREQALLNTK